MTFVGRNDSASHGAVRVISESLRMRGVSADDAIAEVARQGHPVSQVNDLPSVQNHAPSLDSSSLPPNESAGASALFRPVTPAHRLTQVNDLASVENHAPSLDSSSLPPNESAGASALFRPVTPAHRLTQVNDLASVQNHAPSLDSSSLPPNESAGAPVLSRRAVLGRTVFAVLTLVALLTAGYTLEISGEFEKLYSSLSRVASTALRIRANEELHSIDNSTVSAKAGSVSERKLAHNLNEQDFADRTAAQASKDRHSASGVEATDKAGKVEYDNEQKRSDDVAAELAAVRAELADRVKIDAVARKELADATQRLEANEKEWAAKLNAEREQSNGVARDLAAARAELAYRVKIDAVARKELADATQRLEANEKEWAAKLNAEREQSNGVARDLAAARAELAYRVKIDAVARKELADATQRLEANEKEWAAKLNAEREQSNAVARDSAPLRGELPGRSTTEHSARLEIAAPAGWQGMARDSETVRTEHPKRMAAEASVRPTSDFTLNRKTEVSPARQQFGEKTAPKIARRSLESP